MRNLILILLLIFTVSLNAQHSKVNIALKLAIERQKNPNFLFPLFIIGHPNLVKQETRKLGGKVVRSSGNIIQIQLPVKHILQFSKNDFVQSLPYSFAKGEVLSDTMTIHNNITPIHNGTPPLPRAYTGKNVVFGIIDTGHDIVHPDFKDTLGNTRIYRIWDQLNNQYWDSASINNGTCTHVDPHGTSHGTHVSGIGAGNGLAVGMYAGAAPEATIVAVASDFNAPNWLSTVVDAVDYIYSVADSLGLPCVINASIGTYFGSHDGTDPVAVLIDSLVNYKPGRAFVCAAGNAGFFNWHVEHNVGNDTTFTWLKYNASSILGFGSVFYEIWADTIDFNNVNYAFGANLPSGTFEERGRTAFSSIQNRMGNYIDTIKNNNNEVLAIVETYAELQDDKYLLQVLLNEPDSNSYNFSILSTGNGKFDFWSSSLLGTPDIVESGLPSTSIYPPIQYYVKPDSLKTTVSSFSCHPNIITVANFVNRKTYIDVDTILRVKPWTPGEKAVSSSLGPDRRGNLKPDIAATGDVTIGPNAANVIAANMASTPANRAKVALGAMHRTNGGTSMASPVVAGIVALYFEKCPNATNAEVRNAIISSAKQDVFTGSLPNVVFGNGKIDAFAALNTSNYNFTLGSNLDFCENDSVQLTAPTFSSYLWFNGDTSQNIYLDSTQSAYLSVTNASGCIAISDTITATWHPLPNKPIITIIGNDTLLYNSSLNLQWYYNTLPLIGETDTIHVAQNNGDYYVEVTDSFGCKNNSDTLAIVILGIENFIDENIKIYPNPTNGKLTIQTQENQVTSISIYNNIGQLIFTETNIHQRNKLNVDLSKLPKNSYLIKLNTPEKEYIKKLILLH